jgi:hypothetical protein
MLCVLFLDLLVDGVAHVVVGPYYADHCRQDDDQAVPQVTGHLKQRMRTVEKSSFVFVQIFNQGDCLRK